MIKNCIIKYKNFFIAPLCVILILLIIYMIKGIYPFGTTTVANGDMGQSYMTIYHFFYDVIYNGKNFFYDYNLGMGSNMYGTAIVDGLFHPSIFVILLNSRENIPYMVSFIMIIKIAFISLTAFILFNKLYKNNNFYNIIFAILYALSGYVLMYNTNIMWLDVVGLFPLLILSIRHIFKTRKTVWYSIILALMFLFNYNLAYMVLLFVIFTVPIYILLILEKEKRKKAVFDIILGTGIALCLSAFATIPAFIQVMGSYRMTYWTASKIINSNILFKSVVFVFYSLPVYGFIHFLKSKEKKQITIYVLALIFTAIIPILFERVNLLWHMGSYQMFPFRYGFIPIMILFLASLKYFNNYKKIDKPTRKEDYIAIIVIVASLCIATINRIVCAININSNLPAFILSFENFIIILATCILTIISTALVFLIKKEKLRRIIIVILLITEVMIYTYAYIGVDKEKRHGLEWSDEAIFTSYEIKETLEPFNTKNENYRIKDLTASTTENCPLVFDIPSMSTFLHLISKEQIINSSQLGYSTYKTKLNDFGGTLFSDAIYGIKYVLSKQELSNEIYDYVTTSESGIKLYKYKNMLPIGILYDKIVEDLPEKLSIFDAQNYIYKSLFEKEDNIIDKIDNKDTQTIIITQELNENNYTIKIKGKKELYCYIPRRTSITNNYKRKSNKHTDNE